MPAPLRPDTLEDALELLARPMLMQITAGGPPPRMQPHALLMDTGRIIEMSGMHRLGGELVLGLNDSWSDLIRSRLLRPAAGCLVDAAEWMEAEQPGGVLLHALDGTSLDNPVLLALAVLDARIEIAVRESPGRIDRRLLPMRQALQNPPEPPHLPLSLRLRLPLAAAGSALYRESDLSPMQPDVQAAAVKVTLDPDTGRVASARLALAIPGSWPLLCPAIEALIGQQPGPEGIETVARLAAQTCSSSRDDAPHFSLSLSSHLVRETLDRAIARASAG